MSTTTNLEVLRITWGYSLRQLAEELDCSYNAIWRWENLGGWPEPSFARRLRLFFGLPIEVLLAPSQLNDEEAASAKLTTSSTAPSTTTEEREHRES